MTKTQRDKIEAHGRALLAIFPNATEQDPVKLCKKLRRLEAQGAAIGLRLCNGPEYAEGDAEHAIAVLLERVNLFLGNEGGYVPIFVNRDPRGYALKINDGWMCGQQYCPHHKQAEAGGNVCQCDRCTAVRCFHRDWGGYGIIAPEIDKDGN